MRVGKIIALFLLFIIEAQCANWVNYTGIPYPVFGVTNSHWDYTNSGKTFDYGSGPEAYHTTVNGPYTHYIDPQDPSATDTANTYGTPAVPRKTMPMNLVEGSVVELHGYHYYNNGSGGGYAGKMAIISAGTSNNPVYVRAVNTNWSGVISNKDLYLAGGYLTVENLVVTNGSIQMVNRYWALQGLGGGGTMCVRNCEIAGTQQELSGYSIISIGYFSSSFPTNQTTNILIWNNYIHNFGVTNSSEIDFIGIGLTGHDCSNIWVIGNRTYSLSGDGTRYGQNIAGRTSTRVFIAGNLFEINGENGIDIKTCADGVFSQNTIKTCGGSAGSGGQSITVGEYGPSNVWLIGNIVSNGTYGIYADAGIDLYVIGNYFVHQSNEGFNFELAAPLYCANNTFYDCGTYGIHIEAGTDHNPKWIFNNIVADMLAGGKHFYWEPAGSSITNSMVSYNLFYATNNEVAYRIRSTSYTNTTDIHLGSQPTNYIGNPSWRVRPPFLANTSYAINQGTNLNWLETEYFNRFGASIDFDLINQRREIGGAIDVGAVEYSGNLPSVTIRGKARFVGKATIR